jgi:hypothetical protein
MASIDVAIDAAKAHGLADPSVRKLALQCAASYQRKAARLEKSVNPRVTVYADGTSITSLLKRLLPFAQGLDRAAVLGAISGVEAAQASVLQRGRGV